MATVKVKLRRSKIERKAGVLFVQIIHQRQVKFVTTKYRLQPYEWCERTQKVVIKLSDIERIIQLHHIQKELEADLERLYRIIDRFERKGRDYSANDISEEFDGGRKRYQLSVFMNRCIAEIASEGRGRTAQTYRTTLGVFLSYNNDEDVDLEHIDDKLISDFEQHLLNRGLKRNSTSFYMRILRAVYRRAVKQNLCENKQPFRFVYLGVDKTIKRAVSENVIEKLIEYRPQSSDLDFARDMFLFSFYCRGIAFVDLFNLKKSDISEGKLTYFRAKTKQYLSIRMERCMQDIVERHTTDTDYLFPFTVSTSKNGKHTSALWLYNKRLKVISEKLKLRTNLTSYVSRHSWASIAKNKGVATSVISECMGHTNEQTTRIYLASFTQSNLDKANRVVLGIGRRK